MEGSDGTKEKIDEMKDETNSQFLEQASISPNERRPGKEQQKVGPKVLLNEIFTEIEAWSTQAAESEKQKISEKYSFKDQKSYR